MKFKKFEFAVLTGQMILTLTAAGMVKSHTAQLSIIAAGMSLYAVGLMLNIYVGGIENNSAIQEKSNNHFRVLKHDFNNKLQVLYTMIQLKKNEDALNYIKNVLKNSETIKNMCSNSSDNSTKKTK